MKISDLYEAAEKQDGQDKGVVDTDGEEKKVETYENLGTYIAVSVDRLSAKKIRHFAEDHDIDSPVPEEEMHCTILSTKDFLKGFEAEGVLIEPYMINGFELEVWDMKNGNNALVAKFKSEELTARYNAILKEFSNATPLHDEFIPHISISYDAGKETDYDLERMTFDFNEYVDWVALNEEYVEPLNDGSSEDK